MAGTKRHDARLRDSEMASREDGSHSLEGHDRDQKSIRYAMGKHSDYTALAHDAVGFANASGGCILVGIEDGERLPPHDQELPADLCDRLRKRLRELTVNVQFQVEPCAASNGGKYVEVKVFRNDRGVAGTSNGRYYIRVSDTTQPVLPNDLERLVADRGSVGWELQAARLPGIEPDSTKVADFCRRVRESDRVSLFVKGKSDLELMEHYLFLRDGSWTNLGVLWVGRREDRAALSCAPLLQCIKYDDLGNKVQKYLWTDFDLNPLELIESVWRTVPDWTEFVELPDGLFKKKIMHYDERVVRELLANALVHRPYTHHGDLFINLYPDRMEVHNPGRLPIGVTPHNILHVSSKRNPHMARVFYDLKLMEGEGSGYDLMYQVLLASGKAVPVVHEGDDRVVVVVQKQVISPAIVDFMTKADETYQLTLKERITLGLIAQHESIPVTRLVKSLELNNAEQAKPWLGRLRTFGLVSTRERTKATEYFVPPEILRNLNFKGGTTLKGIERHRLRELILRDLEIYRKASISQIHKRIGEEIPRSKLQYELRLMVERGEIGASGTKRHRVYLWKIRGANP